MGVVLTSRTIELGLTSVIDALRVRGARSIVIPSQLLATSSPNLASGEATIVTGYGTSSAITEPILLENYPATFHGAAVRGARGPLPDGRMAAVLNGSSDYLTVPGRVSAHGTLVTSWSPLAGRTSPYALVILFKGGAAGEPLMCRSRTGGSVYGLFTDAFGGQIGNRADAGLTFADTSDASAWNLLIVAHAHGAFGGTHVWKNAVELTPSGSAGGTTSFCDPTNGTLYIGRDVSGGDFFTGTIALAAFVSGLIEQADVDAIYAATRWTDVSADVEGRDPIEWEYGLPGIGPDDVVANTGPLAFTLRNSALNSAGLAGYYSPGHANCREGFAPAIPVRISLGFGGVTYYKFRGRVDDIFPAPGRAGAGGTRVTATDWIEEPSVSPLGALGTETSMTADEALRMVLDKMAQPPAFVSFDTGRDTFPYVFDSQRTPNEPVMGEMGRLVRSERGYLYVAGDTEGGGTLRFENRHARVLDDAFAATLDNEMYELEARRSRRDIVTAVTVTVHPRRLDPAATTVLYALDEAVVPRIGPGETIRWKAGYTDPNSPIAKIGGTNIVTPVASTDYLMNTAEDGSGADVTGSMTVTFTHAGVYGEFLITNGTNADAFVRTLQIRGKGLYQYADILCRASDVGNLQKYGDNHMAIDMPYQTDPNVGQGVADWVEAVWSLEATGIASLSFLANRNSALMTAALAVEPGQRVGVIEDITGITDTVDGASVGYFVHRVGYALTGQMLRVTWTLAPADRERFWILDEVGASELDETTRLAYA